MKKSIVCALLLLFLSSPLLAAPTVMLGSKEADTVKKYMDVKEPAQLDALLKAEPLDEKKASLLLAQMLTDHPDPTLMKVVISHGGNINATFVFAQKRGATLLFIALQQYVKPKVIDFLLSEGADPNARMTGEAAPHITVLMAAAASTPYPEVINMLLIAGADPTAELDGHTAAQYVDSNRYLQNTDVVDQLKRLAQKKPAGIQK